MYIWLDVFDRLLRRYRATSPNLGEEPSYRIGCQCYELLHSLYRVTVLGVSAIRPLHSLFQLWYIGSSPKLG
ncbi:MAG: hypothetical protein LUD00_00140, partial [Prevotellaceae bacterium]|nr:hypothetical protein [Prevotellaceae bacterium]